MKHNKTIYIYRHPYDEHNPSGIMVFTHDEAMDCIEGTKLEVYELKEIVEVKNTRSLQKCSNSRKI